MGVPLTYAAGGAGINALLDLTVRAALRPSPQGWQGVIARLDQAEIAALTTSPVRTPVACRYGEPVPASSPVGD